jgi:chorismate mutase
MVKNPINPDLELWIGAVERIVEIGIKKVAAVHRGFSYYEKARYRNIPHWQIAIEFKQRLPEVPIFCDPSHISGDASIVAEVSQKAMDLKYDGLMIEAHHKPTEAWSDAGQQITPNQLVSLLENLVVRNTFSDDQSFLSILSELRNKIDEIDDQILEVLEKRMAISETIARHKKTSKVTILQPSRWNEILNSCIIKGQKMGLSPEFVETIFKAIHNESIMHQSRVMNEGRNV